MFCGYHKEIILIQGGRFSSSFCPCCTTIDAAGRRRVIGPMIHLSSTMRQHCPSSFTNLINRTCISLLVSPHSGRRLCICFADYGIPARFGTVAPCSPRSVLPKTETGEDVCTRSATFKHGSTRTTTGGSRSSTE